MDSLKDRSGPDGRADVCLIAHFAWGALNGGSSGHIGGVERQTSLMAKWLAARGHRVSLLTWDEGQPDGVEIDGVRVYKACRRDAGIPGVRFVYPRWISLTAAMARADARVYYQNCGEAVTGQAALWCAANRRSFVYSVANDSDCDPSLPLMKRRERILYRVGLKRAALVVVQTNRQRQMLSEGFGVSSQVVPMPCPAPGDDFVPPREPSSNHRNVLWLARLTRQKRPDRLVTLARRCPDVCFHLVGPSDGSEWVEQIIAAARQLRNIVIHGAVARDEVARFYRQSCCLLSTSEFEGFPNTYLEAWSHGIPVVALFDPDGIIREHRLGVSADDEDGLVTAIRAMCDGGMAWQRFSRNGRRYYLENHTVDGVMAAFEDLFVAQTNGKRCEL